MTSTGRAVTEGTLGAWLVKAHRRVSAVDDLLGSGFTSVSRWCVRRSYRTDLVAAGQPVLFWVSGGNHAHPTGIHGEGRTTGPAEAEPGGPGLVVPLRLTPLSAPVPRSELLGHPVLRHLEVLRMAAGSNPSFLTRVELAALRDQWPQVTVGWVR